MDMVPEYNSLWQEDLPLEQQPHVVGRARFGRIAIANSDSGRAAYTDVAIVLHNLLDNAVKFTERGEVRLTVDETDGRLVFTVADTGIGVAQEHLERLFEPFFQVDATLTRRHGGAGVGLAVSRQLTELLGGRVEVASRPGEGATFQRLAAAAAAGC